MTVYIPLSENPRGIKIYAVQWPLTFLSMVFLGLRLYTKVLRRRQFWWDDYFIIAAWIFLLLSCCTTSINVRHGFGLHDADVPPENLGVFGIISNISGFASVLSVTLSKTSFALTLLRLVTDRWMKWLIYGLVALISVTHYISAIFFWVSCNPPAKTYKWDLPGECWPATFTISFSIFVGSCSAFSDFVLALLPWRILLRYNMYNREKLGVAAAMSVGILAGITCIVKLTTVPVLKQGDFSYNSLPLVLWGFIEPACTIIAASIPMMRHLFKRCNRTSQVNDDDSSTHSIEPQVYTRNDRYRPGVDPEPKA
ncbi:hypothetical protein QBC38DRAFT_166815 [Podospora fimiseda]|uniref:Rhodopsin domain-containing protein n=1 Tax=Podospora fimiseda TaxID=252190 RepID=A0AAN7BEV0_9PEZI|nr:hypothetical protein QBC38DRAFT_166815 [Podospora fimiseda]